MRFFFATTLMLFATGSSFSQVSLDFEEGQQWMREGRYLMAEGAFLNLALSGEEVVPVALALAEIARRSPDPSAKIAFYESLLTRSRTWRAASLIVISALTAGTQDYGAFETYATQLLSDYPELGEVRLSLLYHLARYSAVRPDGLVANDGERAWFVAARNLDENETYPVIDESVTGLSYAVRHLHLLERDAPFLVPGLPSDATQDDDYLADLLRIHDAMTREDYAGAARGINQMISEKRATGPGQRRLLELLMSRFFAARDMDERARITAANAARLERWAVLPLVTVPEALVTPEPEPEPEPLPEPVTPETEPETPEAPAVTESVDSPEDAMVDAEADDPYLEMNARLNRGERGLELRIRALPSKTTYRKIFKNYLLGKHYLISERSRDAKEYLDIALQLIKDLPFPHLESEILMTMAAYYASQDDGDKANWYRIDAAQIWAAPQNMPVFVARTPTDAVSPQQVLVDQSLSAARVDEVTERVLYSSERDSFIRERRRAYTRGVSAGSLVLDNQIDLLGNQLYRLVDSLANQVNSSATPERFNQTLALWNSAWNQSRVDYLEPSVPSVSELQALLTRRQHLFAFVEGAETLGVLVLRNDQAFTLLLGSKRNFLALSDADKLGFLSGRLGALWDLDGTIFLHLSPSLRQSNLLTLLRQRVRNPGSFRPVLSLRDMATSKTLAPDNGIGLVLTEGPVPNLPESIRWRYLPLSRTDDATLARELTGVSHVVFVGRFSVTADGLAIGSPNQPFFFHRLLHYNPRLCSLTLAATEVTSWGPVLDELMLIDPSLRVGINLLDDPSRLPDVDFSRREQGINLP